MKALAVIGSLSFAVICTSLATTRQADPPAEQQYQNIVSFKGKKASDIVPAMEFMSASLKVGCDYCHVADRASDEKGEKKTAREMIAMQKDINDKNFGGRNQVTCATCHGGRTHPLTVPPVEGADVRTRRSRDAAPDAAATTLKAFAHALSGDAAPTLVAVKVTGTSTSEGKATPVEATYSAGKFYWLKHAPGGDQKQGFDGSMIWFTTPGGVQKVPLVYAIQFVRENLLYLTPDSLPKQDSPTVGTATIDGHPMQVVSGTLTGSDQRASYFFGADGLLARTVFIYPTILGNIEQINDYSNYQKVGGVEIPMKIVNHSPDGDASLEITAATPAPNVDAALFSPPK